MHNRFINMLHDGMMYFFRPTLHENESFEAFTRACVDESHCGSAAIWRFKYVFDDKNNDYWQSPVETWNRRGGKRMLGDCDDWARFFVHTLNTHNHLAVLLVTWNSTSGHATCLSDNNETIGTFKRVSHEILSTSNTRADTYERVASYWYPDWRGITIYAQNPDTYELTPIWRRYRSEEAASHFKSKKSQVAMDLFVEMLMGIDEEAALAAYNEFVEYLDECEEE